MVLQDISRSFIMRRMQSICLDARKIEIGGIGTYLQNVLKNFPSGCFEVSLLVPSRCKVDLKRFHVIPCDIRDYSIEEQLKLPKLIPKCDLFWTPHFNIPLLPIRARRRLVTLHDLFHLAYASQLSFLERRYSSLFISKAAKKSDRIITVSEFSKSELLRFNTAPSEKVEVIHNGVDQMVFTPCQSGEKYGEVKKKYALPHHYFLFVGNQKKHKNLKGALEGFSTFLSQTESDCYFLIAGSSNGLRHVEGVQALLQRFPHLKGRVIALGHVKTEDFALLYQGALALIFPSFYEGFGLPPLEAMSSHCPVICSRVASLEEVCGNGVYYVDPFDAQSIAMGMYTLWSDPIFRTRLIEKGSARVKAFSWKEAAERHVNLIKGLLE